MSASSPKSRTERKIIGLSLSPETAKEVKIEAARRGITLRKLFEEMWEIYRKATPGENHEN